jgi:hypothetical protein
MNELALEEIGASGGDCGLIPISPAVELTINSGHQTINQNQIK